MISVENSHLSFEALLVISNSSSAPLTATNYKPCFKVILGETVGTMNISGKTLILSRLILQWRNFN